MAKTLKAVSKRLKITKRKKLLRRVSQQGHFKAKEPGKVTRLKRKTVRANMHPELRKVMKKYSW